MFLFYFFYSPWKILHHTPFLSGGFQTQQYHTSFLLLISMHSSTVGAFSSVLNPFTCLLMILLNLAKRHVGFPFLYLNSFASHHQVVPCSQNYLAPLPSEELFSQFDMTDIFFLTIQASRQGTGVCFFCFVCFLVLCFVNIIIIFNNHSIFSPIHSCTNFLILLAKVCWLKVYVC